MEVVPGGPTRHEVGVGDQHARRVRVRAKHTDRFAGLDQQSFVVLKRLQGGYDGVEILPRARRPADAAVDDEFVRVLGDIGVKVVHQHPQRGLGQPAFGVECGTARRAHFAGVVAWVCHGENSYRSAATASMRVSKFLR